MSDMEDEDRAAATAAAAAAAAMLPAALGAAGYRAAAEGRPWDPARPGASTPRPGNGGGTTRPAAHYLMLLGEGAGETGEQRVGSGEGDR